MAALGWACMITGRVVTRIGAAVLLLAAGLSCGVSSASSSAQPPSPRCGGDGPSCQAHLQSLMGRLDAGSREQRGRERTLQAVEHLRNGIISGGRIELPSWQRQHLEKVSPVFGDISYDTKHRPVAGNASKQLIFEHSIAENLKVRLHTFLPVTAVKARGQVPGALMLLVDEQSTLSVHSMTGEVLLDRFNLGHKTAVTRLALSPTQGTPSVLTADESGEMRVHDLTVRPLQPSQVAKEENATSPKVPPATMEVLATFGLSFQLPANSKGQARPLTAILVVEKGSALSYVTGDALGGVAVFGSDGVLRSRVKVTDDPGGVVGLLQGQGQSVLFFSSHRFGFLTGNLADVQTVPCNGWSSPAFDLAYDPVYAANRVVVALSNGDVLVFSTTKEQGVKPCDLVLKFPRVSRLPLRLQSFKGYMVGLPALPAANAGEAAQDLYFFQPGAMEAGYGIAPSRAVAVQASFAHKQPDMFALLHHTTEGAYKPSAHIAIRFDGLPGIDFYNVTLRTPQLPRIVGVESESSGWSTSDLGKIAIFGVAMIGVVIWNFRKSRKPAKSLSDDFDDDDDEPKGSQALKDEAAKAKENRRQGDAKEGDDHEKDVAKLRSLAEPMRSPTPAGIDGDGGGLRMAQEDFSD